MDELTLNDNHFVPGATSLYNSDTGDGRDPEIGLNKFEVHEYIIF